MKKIWIFSLPVIAMLFIFGKCKDDEGNTIELPASIQQYLNSHYQGAEIEEPELDTLCTGAAVYEVELEVSDDNELDLSFDTEGNLLFSETEINSDELPEVVKAAINAQYATFQILEAGRMDMADGSKRYEAELKKGQTILEVLFNADGTVVCEQAGGDDD